MVVKFMVEKFMVEMFMGKEFMVKKVMVEMFMVEKSMAERSSIEKFIIEEFMLKALMVDTWELKISGLKCPLTFRVRHWGGFPTKVEATKLTKIKPFRWATKQKITIKDIDFVQSNQTSNFCQIQGFILKLELNLFTNQVQQFDILQYQRSIN